MFNFFLSLIILHSKGFCSFHVLWQLNNNLYSTIKMNKNPDNINRYLSSLRRFASLNEILQNHEKTSWFSLSQVAVDKTQKTRQFLLTKAAEGAKLPPICRFHRPYRKRSNSLIKVWLSNKEFHFLILWKAPFKWGRWNTTLRAKFKHPNSATTANTTSCVATKTSRVIF